MNKDDQNGRLRLVFLGWLPVLAILGLTVLSLARNSVWSDAIRLWEEAVQRAPSSSRAHFNLGNAYNEKGRFNDAIAQYSRALASRARVREQQKIFNNLGLACFRSGWPDQAIEYYRKALTYDPAFAEAHFNLGLALLNRRRYGPAVEEFQAVLQSDPEHADAYNNIGLAFIEENRFSKAGPYLDAAIRLNPDFAEAYNNRGIVESGSGKIALAIRDFRRATSLKQDFADAFYNLALACKKAGLAGEAEEYLRRARRLDPTIR